MSNNSSKKQFNVRLDDELVEWLKNYAAKEQRTVPAQLTCILEKEKHHAEAQQNSANQ